MGSVIPPGTWYQEATINGVKMPQRRHQDTSEKRWSTLIEPLLPFKGGVDRRVIELGSNAGFYLRKMADLGFQAIGVEREDEFIAHARYWEDNDPKGTLTIQADLNKYALPSCQILLLAQVHYWLTSDEVRRLVERASKRAMYVILVGRFRPMKRHRSDCRIEPLREYFNGWIEGEMTQNEKHFGVIFKNPSLVEKNTNELSFHQQLMKSRKFRPAFEQMVQDVKSGKLTSLCEKHPYYKYLEWRKDSNRKRRFVKKIKLIHSVLENGLVKPLIVGRLVNGEFDENRLYDGDHRYIIARELGISKIICQRKRYGKG